MRSGQGPRRRLASGCRVVEAAAPSVAALPPAAWLSGPRDPWLIELHPLIRLSLRQLAANLKYGCLLSYLTLLPPTRCCRRAHVHSHTHTRTHTQHTAETECPIYSGAIKVGPFCDFSFALSRFVKAVIFHRLALTTARTLPNSWPWHAVRVISLFFFLFVVLFSFPRVLQTVWPADWLNGAGAAAAAAAACTISQSISLKNTTLQNL